MIFMYSGVHIVLVVALRAAQLRDELEHDGDDGQVKRR